MLNPKEKMLILQTFYTPMKPDSTHEMMHVVHDVSRGAIHRVYTDGFIVKNLGQQQELDGLPRLGEFTTTTREFADVINDAAQQGILNKPLTF
jgi:hypothetical protein